MKFLPTFLYAATILGLLSVKQPTQAATGYAGEFLALGAGGRGLALGGAYVALVDDATAGYWNPAALTGTKRTLHIMHSQRFAGLVSHDFAAVNFNEFLFFNGFSIGFLRLGVNDIAFTTLPNPTAPVSADNRPQIASTESSSDYALYVSGGHRLSERLDAGISVKLLYRNVASFTAYGTGLDVGARFRLNQHVIVAAVVRDVTTTPIVWNTDTTDRIRPSLNFGISFSRDLGSGIANIAIGSRAGGDAKNHSADPLLAGVEYDLGKLSLRAGLQEGQQTLGVGIKARGALQLDVAYQRHDDLEATYVFSATTTF